MAEYENSRDDLEKLHSSLKTERSTWDPHWKELSDYIMPRRSRFLGKQANKGDRRNQKIIDNTATLASRTLKSGMHSGITSPARPWFRLTTPDPDLAEFGPVKEWLYLVTQRMQTVFHRSNIYNALPIIYGDCGTFGTAACALFEDDRDLIRAYTYPIGSYMLANSERGQTDTLVREFSMTARQIMQRFEKKDISITVQNLADRGSGESWVDVVQVVTPNENYDPNKGLAKYKLFKSCIYEKGSSTPQFLRESGFDEFPILGPRWDVTGEDVYGSSPGMDALGDIKQLQNMQRRKSQAIDKKVNPPMVGDPSLRNQKASLLPGDITYVAATQATPGFRPAFEVNFRIDELKVDIQETQNRISRAFYEDLFLMMATSDRRQITATEVAERHEEKLLMLGPVLERLNDELLNPLIDRTFNMMMRANFLPPPPPELENVKLRVEHVSIMAQAQKMVATASIDRFFGFAGNLASVKQDVVDKVDFDQAIDEYSEMMGVPPTMVRSDEDVAAMRQARAQAAQEAQRVERMQEAAQGAKTLSETDMGSDSALNRIIKNMRGA